MVRITRSSQPTSRIFPYSNRQIQELLPHALCSLFYRPSNGRRPQLLQNLVRRIDRGIDVIITVCSGQEGFLSDLGPFNFLGVDAILNEHYKPDFSAKVINKAKILKITRTKYMKAISNIKNFQR